MGDALTEKALKMWNELRDYYEEWERREFLQGILDSAEAMAKSKRIKQDSRHFDSLVRSVGYAMVSVLYNQTKKAAGQNPDDFISVKAEVLLGTMGGYHRDA